MPPKEEPRLDRDQGGAQDKRLACGSLLPSVRAQQGSEAALSGQMIPARTRHRPKTEDEKAALRAAGFQQAEGPGWCCSCGKRIGPGQWIRRMPTGYRGRKKTKHHMAHRACVMSVLAELSAKTGRQVTL